MDRENFKNSIIKHVREDYAKAHRPALNVEIEASSFKIPMSDGINLNCYMIRPKVNHTLPVILQRTCYPFSAFINQIHGEELAKRGYAYIYQFCRGIEKSEGSWTPNENERQDGLDTLNWLQEQAWIDCIGYWGESYLALTGWAVADQVPDKVKSMCLGFYGTDRYTSAYQNGAFRQDVLTAWAMENAGFPIKADYIESCKFLPHIEVDQTLWGREIPWYRDWISNPRAESPYWQQGFWKTLHDIPEQVNVPVYITEGWYDHHLGSALKTYEALNTETKEHSWFQIGPWNHFSRSAIAAHNPEHIWTAENLTPLKWFDQTLIKKEIPDKIINIYMIGQDHWQKFTQWPPNDTAELILFLGENSRLAERAADDGSVSYLYDPTNPVPSHGCESMLHSMSENGSLLQPEPGYREDVISFISQPLRQDQKITGSIIVNLFVSTDGQDTAFTAKVMEVKPDGKAYNIRSSITTVAHSLPASEKYLPDSILPVQIEMWDIAYTIKQGSQIRIDISSSDFPQYNAHTNFAGLWSEQRQTRIARQTIYFGEKHPSAVVFPRIEKRSLE